MRECVAIIGIVAVFFACSETRKDDKPMEVTVCEVAANPRGFDERLVRMRAQIESDGRARTRLSDGRCRSAWITVASRPAPGANLREMKAVLFGKESGTLDREVTATFVGRIHANALGSPRYTIELVSASDITVKHLNDGGALRRSHE